MSFYYQIAGIKLKSELEFSGLQIIPNDSYDISLALGDVPPIDETYERIGVTCYANSNKLILNIKNLMNFFVTDANKIILYKQEKTTNQDVKAFLIDIIIPYLLYCRGYLVIRASGVKINQQVIFFVGNSASFKSTIAGAMAQLNYPIVADDFIVIDPHGVTLKIIPTNLPLQLWEDSCNNMSIAFNNLTKVRDCLFKYEVPYPYLPVTDITSGIVYQLGSSNQLDNKIEDIAGTAKLNTLISNTLCYPFLKIAKQEVTNLKNCIQVTKLLKFRSLTIGHNTPAATLAKLIDEDIKQCIK